MEGVGLSRDVAPRHWSGRGDDIMLRRGGSGVGGTHTHTVLLWLGSAMDRRRVPGVQVRVGGGVSGVPWVLGSGRHGSARSRGGGGWKAAGPQLGYCPVAGGVPGGCPESRSGSGPGGAVIRSPTPPPERGAGPERGWTKGLTGYGAVFTQPGGNRLS